MDRKCQCLTVAGLRLNRAFSQRGIDGARAVGMCIAEVQDQGRAYDLE